MTTGVILENDMREFNINESGKKMNHFKITTALAALLLVSLLCMPAMATNWALIHQDAAIEEPITNLSIVDENNLFFATNAYDYSGSLLGTKIWVRYSADGGATLENRYFVVITAPTLFFSETAVTDVHMTSATEGFVTGMYADGIFGMGPWVGWTGDGGQTFEKLTEFPSGILVSYPLNKMEFVTPAIGIAMGYTSLGFLSDDSGANWTQMDPLPSKYYTSALEQGNEARDIAYDGASGIYICAAYGYDYPEQDGELFYSPDLGVTWSQIYDYEAAGFSQAGFGSVQFLDADHGWMTVRGENSFGVDSTAILYTTNGAANWQQGELPSGEMGDPGDYVITDIYMSKLTHGWAVGYNTNSLSSILIYTTDGGETWEFDDYVGAGALVKIEMTSHRRGWAMGYNQTVISFKNEANAAPVADAGIDRNVNPGATVTLDGTDSYDPDGDDITYAWTLLVGEAPLDDATSPTPTFASSPNPTCYSYQLIVTDELGLSSDPDVVDVSTGDAICDDDDADDDDDNDDAEPADDDDDDDDESGCCG